MAIDHAVKALFQLVVIPRCIALGLQVPPLPELFRLLEADDMCVFVQDIFLLMPWRTDRHGMWLFGENCTLEYLHGG